MRDPGNEVEYSADCLLKNRDWEYWSEQSLSLTDTRKKKKKTKQNKNQQQTTKKTVKRLKKETHQSFLIPYLLSISYR